eukprot:GHVS01020359.1.p1 GENE.GHVS01020359.1~~GHVS01020359.1.p1  ORF type:complete len:446 (+),score=24.41 GHVS01020359.1:107-1444(+)
MSHTTVAYLDYPIYSIGSDGKYVLTAGGGGGAEYGIEDQLEVHEYNPSERSLTHLGCHSDLVKGVVDSIVYSPQSQLWACCLKSYCLVFKVDPETAEPKILQKVQTDFTEPEGRQTVVRFSPSGELLITGGDEKILRVWRLELPSNGRLQGTTGENAMQLVAELKGHNGDVKDCAITADSLTAATCASDNTFRLWDIKTGQMLHSQEMDNPKNKQQKLVFRCCRFVSPPGGGPKCLFTLACGPRGPSYAIHWRVDVSTDRSSAKVVKLRQSWIDNQASCALAVSDDYNYYAVGFVSGGCKVFDSRMRLLRSHLKHGLPITGIVFLNRGQTVVSSGADYSLATMELATDWFWGSRWLCSFICVAVVLIIALVSFLYTVQDAAHSGLHILMTKSTEDTRTYDPQSLAEFVDYATRRDISTDSPDTPSVPQDSGPGDQGIGSVGGGEL